MTDNSSDSEDRYNSRHRGRSLNNLGSTSKVEHLTGTLRDTKKNLNSIGKLMEAYRDAGHKPKTDLNRGRSISGGLESRQALASAQFPPSADDLVLIPRGRLVNNWGPGVGGAPSALSASMGALAGLTGQGELYQLHQSMRDLATQQSKITEEMTRMGKQQGRGLVSDSSNLIGTGVLSPGLEHRLTLAHEDLKKTAGISAGGRRRTDGDIRPSSVVSSSLQAALDRHHQTGGKVAVALGNGSDVVADTLLKSKLTQSEAAKSAAESEAEGFRRRLGQEEGSSSLLKRQLEDVQTALDSTSKEKARLKARVEELEGWTERARRKLADESNIKEDRGRLELVAQELQLKLAQSVPVIELEEARRHAEKLQRQRELLTEQISRLSRDLESKELQVSRLLDEARDSQTQLEVSDRMRTDSVTTTTALEREIKEIRRREEAALERASQAEREAHQARAELDAARVISDDVIKQWKGRCAHYQKDLARANDLASEQTQRAVQTGRELDHSRAQGTGLQCQLDTFRREMEALLSTRARDEELARRRDEENEELRLKGYELEAKSNSADKIAEKCQFEVEALQHELHGNREARARLEEKLCAAEALQMTSKDQLEQMNRQLLELTRHKEELTTSLYEASGQIKEKDRQEDQIRILNRRLEDIQHQHQTSIQSSQKKLRSSEKDSATRIAELSSRLSEEERAARALMERCERQTLEIARLCDQRLTMEQDSEKLNKKLDRSIKRHQDKELNCEESSTKVEQLKKELSTVNDRHGKTVSERDRLLTTFAVEVDAIVEVLVSSSFTKNTIGRSSPAINSDLECLRSTVLTTPAGLDPGCQVTPARWSVDLAAKLQWLSSEVQVLVGREKESRLEVKDREDRLAELTENLEEREGVEHRLVEEIRHLEQCLEREKTEQLRQNMDIIEAQTSREAQRLRDETERETNTMQERYKKLQNTLNIVRRDLGNVDFTQSSESIDKHGRSLNHSVKFAQSSPMPRPRSELRARFESDQ